MLHANGELCDQLGIVYWYCDCLQEAEELGHQIFSNHKRLLGEGLWSTLLMTSTYEGQGRLQEAEILNMQVLGAQKRVIGEQNPNMLGSVAWSCR